MSYYGFDAKNYEMQGVILALVADTVTHNGYGDFISEDGSVEKCHYREAERYLTMNDAEDAVKKYKKQNSIFSKLCDIVQINCEEEEEDD